jgi:phosphoribosylamine---glycine ligase
MHILVIGQGGREHAIVRALSLSPSVQSVHAIPGSPGMKGAAIRHNVNWKDFDAVAKIIADEDISLTVIGPEIPLAEGLSDALRAKGHLVFGPSQEAAKLESSKVYSKRFMVDAGVPTARSFEVRSVQETFIAATNFKPPFVLKADGLAAGKGVFICKDEDELKAAAHSIFVEKTLGPAGELALLEEFSPGYEISCLVLTNGETWEPLILAADHKRLEDNDKGPNTGGMGTVAPYKIDSSLQKRIDEEVWKPMMKHLKKSGLVYRGVLYAGLMITDKGPSNLEFNVRFGDPEAQVILPLLDGDWGEVMLAIAKGEVPKLKWKNQAAACVVLAAEGYPDNPKKNVVIEGDLNFESAESYFLHAGTDFKNQKWVTAGGRVLNAIGLGRDVKAAIEQAYKQTSRAQWPGLQYRSDIGNRVSGD